MANKRNSQDLALVPDGNSPRTPSLASVITPWLFHGSARSEDEIFIYVEQHFNWPALVSDKDLIIEAKMARIRDTLHVTSTLDVRMQDGTMQKKKVRKFLKPTEYDADGNAEKRWKPAVHCTEKQLQEVGAGYVKLTIESGEATNAYNVHASKIIRDRALNAAKTQLALPATKPNKKPKIIPTPPNQNFMDFMEVVSVNPDTGDRTLQVKIPEPKTE